VPLGRTVLTTRHDTSVLGHRMTRRMIELGLSDRDVSAGSNLSYDTIRAIRRLPNKNPTMDTISRIAKALGVTPEWLLHGTRSEQSKTDAMSKPAAGAGLSIREAKEALARHYDVPIASIDIIIKG
jgi:transcriptional regulator with XRE-family HTH domain